MTTQGCPRCGADRLKAAPVPIVDVALNLFSARRRYKCAACGWAGRRHRLRRRSQDLPSLSPRSTPRGMAVGFFVMVVLFLLTTGALLMRSCNEAPRGPVEGAGSP